MLINVANKRFNIVVTQQVFFEQRNEKLERDSKDASVDRTHCSCTALETEHSTVTMEKATGSVES